MQMYFPFFFFFLSQGLTGPIGPPGPGGPNGEKVSVTALLHFPVLLFTIPIVM